MKNIVANLFSIICVIVAGVCLFYEIDGWGWFLFVALICHSSQSLGE